MAVYKDENKTKDGRCWYFRVYKDGKQFKSKRYPTKKEAQEEEALFILKRDNPQHKAFDIVAKGFFNDFSKKIKESTLYSYEKDYINHIKPFFEKYSIKQINVTTISKWAEWLEKKKISVDYMNKIHNILNCIFDYAIKEFGILNNPSRIYGSFKKKNDQELKIEKIRYITFDEFEKFITVIDNILWKTFFTFLYYTGMRKGEVQALTWKDIDFEKNEINVNKNLSVKTKDIYKITSTKNYQIRKIKMSQTLIKQLLEYKIVMQSYKDFSENWFVFGNTRFTPSVTIDRYKHKYFLASGIKEITIHEFRHSHVSLLINEYIKSGQTDTAKFFLMMSNRMGHSIPVMQEVYMHLFPTIQDEIVNILDNL